MLSGMKDAPGDLIQSFTARSVELLRDVYVPRLRSALERLPAGELWSRPGGAISFGTILLHLEGNVRQWILSGLGDAEDRRDRDAEFSATDGPDGAELLRRLEATVGEAAELIAGLDAAQLAATHEIQGRDEDAFWAVYHVVEHFGYHTGQAVWIAKSHA